MSKGGKRQGSGRKKKAPTALLNLRIDAGLKAELKAKFGKTLNKKIINFLKKELNEQI